MTADEVLDLVEKEIPEDIQIIARNIVERLQKNKLLSNEDEALADQFARVISNEPSFKALIKSVDT